MKFEILPEKYTSPRITGEFADCSMPMTFDQYNNCAFGCVYCFSQYQRGVGQSAKRYIEKKIKAVSPKKFKWYFENPDDPKNPFGNFIKNRITLQWGGLSDPFCPIEEDVGLGYELLEFLREIRYPVNFSSKGDLLLRKPEYLKLFEGMGDVWSYKASIITLDEAKANRIEMGCPSPQRRIEVLKALADMGIWTIWRLRPFIIGLSDLDYEEQLKIAGEIGVRAISTEFFCLELRSMGIAKAKYDLMSEVLGFDIIQYYKNISSTSGYLRLNRKVKEPYYKRMKELCDQYGINMHVSDAHGKEYSASGSCCGLPAENGCASLTKFHQCQFTEAINIAKRNGQVTWDDIAEQNLFPEINMPRLPGLNTGNNEKREKKCSMDLYHYLRNLWNNPKDANSPYRYFQGVLYPAKLDENKNIIYEYRPYDEEKPKIKTKKIILVVGQSASGKTTWVKNNFIKENYENKKPQKYIKICQSGNNILFGHYNINKRCEGTDTLSYAALPIIKEYIKKIIDSCENIILEGDRITSKQFLDFLETLNIEIEVHYFITSLENSIKRREESNSKASENFVKTTITKTKNFSEYVQGKNIKLITHEN